MTLHFVEAESTIVSNCPPFLNKNRDFFLKRTPTWCNFPINLKFSQNVHIGPHHPKKLGTLNLFQPPSCVTLIYICKNWNYLQCSEKKIENLISTGSFIHSFMLVFPLKIYYFANKTLKNVQDFWLTSRKKVISRGGLFCC